MNPPSERRFPHIPLAKAEAGASSGAASFLEDLIDACVMECYFREHMAERDLLFHDTLAPHLAAYAPGASAAQQRDFLTHGESMKYDHPRPLFRRSPSMPEHRRDIVEEGRKTSGRTAAAPPASTLTKG